jgi:hypothetical protein
MNKQKLQKQKHNKGIVTDTIDCYNSQTVRVCPTTQIMSELLLLPEMRSTTTTTERINQRLM